MAYGDFEDLAGRSTSDKVLHNRAFDIAKNPRYDEYQSDITGGAVKSEIMPNKEFAEELHKQINRKFEKQKVHSSFKDNICGC